MDDLGRPLVLQLGLRDAAHVKQLLQLGVQVEGEGRGGEGACGLLREV